MPHISLKSYLFAIGLLALFAGSTILYARPLSSWLWLMAPSSPMAVVVIALSPHDINLHLAIGEYFFNHGAYDIERARGAYERVLAIDSDHRDAHYQLARIYFLKGNFFLAKRHIDRVLAIDPEYAKGYYMKGLILGYRGDLVEATENFEEFIRRTPYEWAGYNDLAWFQFQLGQFEDMEQVTREGLDKSSHSVWLLNMHGLALYNLGEEDEARVFFEEAQGKVEEMKPADWGQAYPGNDPDIYAEGLERMREAIDHNLELVRAE